jgi:hypothetical protein
MNLKPRAVQFVRYDRIQDQLGAGWIVLFPNAPHHHMHYGIELAWLCECPLPEFNRVPETQTESANERAGT